jgi:hypothetical protein
MGEALPPEIADRGPRPPVLPVAMTKDEIDGRAEVPPTCGGGGLQDLSVKPRAMPPRKGTSARLRRSIRRHDQTLNSATRTAHESP